MKQNLQLLTYIQPQYISHPNLTDKFKHTILKIRNIDPNTTNSISNLIAGEKLLTQKYQYQLQNIERTNQELIQKLKLIQIQLDRKFPIIFHGNKIYDFKARDRLKRNFNLLYDSEWNIPILCYSCQIFSFVIVMISFQFSFSYWICKYFLSLRKDYLFNSNQIQDISYYKYHQRYICQYSRLIQIMFQTVKLTIVLIFFSLTYFQQNRFIRQIYLQQSNQIFHKQSSHFLTFDFIGHHSLYPFIFFQYSYIIILLLIISIGYSANLAPTVTHIRYHEFSIPQYRLISKSYKKIQLIVQTTSIQINILIKHTHLKLLRFLFLKIHSALYKKSIYLTQFIYIASDSFSNSIVAIYHIILLRGFGSCKLENFCKFLHNKIKKIYKERKESQKMPMIMKGSRQRKQIRDGVIKILFSQMRKTRSGKVKNSDPIFREAQDKINVQRGVSQIQTNERSLVMIVFRVVLVVSVGLIKNL